MDEESAPCHSLEDLFKSAKLDETLVPFKALTGADDLDDVLESTDEVRRGSPGQHAASYSLILLGPLSRVRFASHFSCPMFAYHGLQELEGYMVELKMMPLAKRR